YPLVMSPPVPRAPCAMMKLLSWCWHEDDGLQRRLGVEIGRALLLPQAGELDDEWDLDRAPAGARNPRRDGDGLIEVVGLDHEEAAQLLVCLGERAVGHQPLAVAHAHAGRRGRRMQRRGRDEVPFSRELVCQLRGFLI